MKVPEDGRVPPARLFEILEFSLRNELERASPMDGVVDLNEPVQGLTSEQQATGFARLDVPGFGLLVVTEELLAPRITGVHDAYYPEGVTGCLMPRAYHSPSGPLKINGPPAHSPCKPSPAHTECTPRPGVNLAPLSVSRTAWSRGCGTLSSFTLLLGALLFLASTAVAEAPSDPEAVGYETSDGLRVAALLYRPSAASSEAAVVFLRAGSTHHEGETLARHLSNHGSWVLVPDPGATSLPESGRPLSPDVRDARDGAAALSFLHERLGEATIPVLIGIERGANAAVRTRLSAGPGPLVLFDPPAALVGLLPGSAAAPGPVLMLAGREDPAARDAAQSIWKLRPRGVELWLLDGKRGIVETMLSRQDFAEDLAAWITNAKKRPS